MHVRSYNGKPFYEARWRDLERRQRRRRLGRAWLELNSAGEWVPRRGRVRRGYLDERRAYPLMAAVIEAHEEKLRRAVPSRSEALFAEVVEAWLVYVQTEKRVKPATLRNYRRLLAQPVGRRSPRRGRIMREFGRRPLFEITTVDARRFLAKLDLEDISARTVNIHRQVLHAIFQFARREESFGLPSNPFAGTTKRPEDGAKPIETFEPNEILVIARAARQGLHRRKGGYKHSVYSVETEREWSRVNEQDAAFFTIAAFTGMRLGELLALRWRDVDLEGGVLTVSRSISAGQETSTKSRRARTVPLAEQAIAEFKRLRERDHFTGRDDYVFCRPDGGRINGAAVRDRFIRVQKKAGVRVRRFHDLRHTFGSLAIRRFDLVAVKEMMGHSQLTTTERYLHTKPRPTDAAKLTAIFAEGEEAGRLALAA
ncbi:MAG TPA: tyrosine-type recombinase/integrase [Solirubrobacterales bacterium]|nr:tyrosine-type recombinase/integrase [Solirubrobacterales bacterium]